MIGYIYVIVDPTTFSPRYVGQTVKDPKRRLYEHLKCARRGSEHHVHRWIRSLFDKPLLFVAERVEKSYLDNAERQWIAFLRSCGCDLTNLTDGGRGQGVPGYVRTAEHSAKIAAANRGKRRSVAARRNIAAGSRGRMCSDMTRMKMSIAHRGHPVSNLTRLRISNTQKGRPGRKQSPETRAKIGEASRLKELLKRNGEPPVYAPRCGYLQESGKRCRRVIKLNGHCMLHASM